VQEDAAARPACPKTRRELSNDARDLLARRQATHPTEAESARRETVQQAARSPLPRARAETRARELLASAAPKSAGAMFSSPCPHLPR
jgi:hypothetical protein